MKWLNMKKSKKILLFFYLLIGISLLGFNNTNAEEEYSPYPIVFVHGLGSNYTEAWGYTRGCFYEDYFNGKYTIDNISYLFPVCDYSPANMDLTDYPVSALKAAIDHGIDCGFPLNYKGEKKVMVVAHSMGGLVIRALLRQDSSYQNKIDRVVFLGTPHQGSPLVSAYWLINEESKKIDEKIKDNSMYAKNALGHFYIGKYLAYQSLLSNMRFIQNINVGTIKTLDMIMKIKPDDIALKQLRVPSDILSQVNFTGIGYGLLGPVFPAIVSDKVEVGHLANGDNKDGQVGTKIVTFVNNDMLATPQSFSTIKGTGGTLWGSILTVAAKFGLFRTYSGFPNDNTLSDLITGDGFVTQYGQTALEGSTNVISKYVSHLSEPDEKEAILQAIEDKPEIVGVRAVPVNWNKTYACEGDDGNSMYYIIFKVRDYLLADIEIEALTLDEADIIPDSFKKDGKVKPYYAIGKSFLKERDCNGKDSPNELAKYIDIEGNDKYLKLKPGEFYIKTKIPYNAQSLYIKIKNPAAEYAQDPDNFSKEEIIEFQKPVKFYRFWHSGSSSNPPLVDAPEYGANPHQIDIGFTMYGFCRKVRLNAWIYDESGKVVRKIATNQIVSLEGTDPYWCPGCHYSDFTFTWNGKDDSGGYVPHNDYPWPGQLNPSFPFTKYKLKVTVDLVDEDGLYLLTTNWDGNSLVLSSSAIIEIIVL